MGEDQLAWEISKLDPYNITLESLRRKMIGMVERYIHD